MTPRTFLGLAFVAVIAFLVIALGGGFEAPKDKAESAARQCATSRDINLLKDAERYCGQALEILAREKDIPAHVVAYTNTEVASLALAQQQVERAVSHCRVAVAEWRRADRNMRIYGFDPDAAIGACNKLIADSEARRADGENRKEIGRLSC